MAWIEGEHKPIVKRASKEILAETKGKLSQEEAQVWFAKYCEKNPAFAIKLLTGYVELYPIQDMLIRSFFMRDFGLMIAGRGFSKSYTISLFIILYALFTPGVKIIVCSGTFRQSKLIFKQIEEFIAHPKAIFLRQCITKQPSHLTDCHEVEINGSRISAVPLTARIRGMRANLVVVDELFLVPTEIMNSVIKPFLNVQYKAKEQAVLKAAEDILIEQGKLKEEDRTPLINNKLIGLSSASFEVEDLYKSYYLPYITDIQNKDAKGVNHFVTRLSYEAAPEGLMNMVQIDDAKRTSSSQQFDKEYRALFLSESGGYFSIQQILAASVGEGDEPCVRVVGDKQKKYILAIDPNYSDSDVADDFAMCVLELDEENRSGTLVHAYALSQSNITKRAQYLQYLLESFNIVFIIVDNAGGPKFIEDCNQFLSGKTKNLSLIEGDFMEPDKLKESINSYNLTSGRIVYSQVFSKNGWIRVSNETLKANIEYKKIKFASRVWTGQQEDIVKEANIPTTLEYKKDTEEDKKFDGAGTPDIKIKLDFSYHLYEMVELTKTQLSFIDASTTEMGVQRFDLPKSQRANRGPNRTKKDSYVALQMASWGMKAYFDILDGSSLSGPTFRPVRIGKY